MADSTMGQRKILCEECKHYLAGESSHSCSTTAINMLNNIYVNLEGEESESMKLLRYKTSCRVVINDPSEMDKIDPYTCKYFLSNKYTFFMK